MLISIRQIKEISANKWLQILPAVGGIAPELLDHRHHSCPVCGGKDRWRLIEKKSDGHNLCNQCGSRDGLQLLSDISGQSLNDVIQAVAAFLGITDSKHIQHTASTRSNPIQPKEKALPDLKKKARCEQIWRESKPITPESVAGRYLASRGLGDALHFIDAGALRFHEGVDYCQPNANRDGYTILGQFPAMLGRIQSKTGEFLGLHITYLEQNGRGKAPVPAPKQMKTFLPLAGTGACVRLGGANPVSGFIGLAEGLESGLAAAFINSAVPVWVAMTAGLIGSFEPPENTDSIVVFTDNDHAGLKAAERLKEQMLGRVFMDIVPPDSTVNDWNDQLLALAGAAE